MLTAEQLTERKGYIGGSDIAGVLGLSRWKTPLQIWASKTGAVPDEDLSDVLAVEMGNELEDVVCRLFAKKTGKKVARVNKTFIHPSYKFFGANIDRRVVGEDAIMEAKTCSGWRAKEWENEGDVPPEYLLQVMWYLAVTGEQKAYLAVLVGGNQDFVIKTVERDPKLISDMMHKAAEFWTKFVEPKVMPTAISRNDSDVLYKLFPHGDDSDALQLGDDAARVCEGIASLTADLKAVEGALEREQNTLKALLGDKAVAIAGKYRITWTDSQRSGLDSKAIQAAHPDIAAKFNKTTKFRKFSCKQMKGGKE